MKELRDRVAIVTGASRGIGKATAIALAEAGAAVVVAARTEVEGEKLPGTIHATAGEIVARGGRALPIQCDVRDEESVNRMVETAVAEFGRVDVLINNAVAGSYRRFLDLPVKEWDVVVAVGLRGPFLCCRAVLPDMVRRRSGSIVNISSKAADSVFSSTIDEGSQRLTVHGQAYGATKAALERLTVGLAVEMGKHNIAVNCVKPMRPVLTEGLRLQRQTADLSNWVGVEGMVKAVLFLAAQDATGVTGVVTTDEELMRNHGL